MQHVLAQLRPSVYWFIHCCTWRGIHHQLQIPTKATHSYKRASKVHPWWCSEKLSMTHALKMNLHKLIINRCTGNQSLQSFWHFSTRYSALMGWATTLGVRWETALATQHWGKGREGLRGIEGGRGERWRRSEWGSERMDLMYNLAC